MPRWRRTCAIRTSNGVLMRYCRSNHYRLQQTWAERWLPCAALCGLGGLSRLLQVCLETCWQLLWGCKDWLWVFSRMHESPSTCQIHRAQSIHSWISISRVGPCWGVWIPATMSSQHQSAMWVPLLLELAKDHCYVKKHAPSPAGGYMGCNPEDDFPWPRDNSRKRDSVFCRVVEGSWLNYSSLSSQQFNTIHQDHWKCKRWALLLRSVNLRTGQIIVCMFNRLSADHQWHHVHKVCIWPTESNRPWFWALMFSRCFAQWRFFFTWLSCNAGTLNSAAVTKEAKANHKIL